MYSGQPVWPADGQLSQWAIWLKDTHVAAEVITSCSVSQEVAGALCKDTAIHGAPEWRLLGSKVGKRAFMRGWLKVWPGRPGGTPSSQGGTRGFAEPSNWHLLNVARWVSLKTGTVCACFQTLLPAFLNQKLLS